MFLQCAKVLQWFQRFAVSVVRNKTQSCWSLNFVECFLVTVSVFSQCPSGFVWEVWRISLNCILPPGCMIDQSTIKAQTLHRLAMPTLVKHRGARFLRAVRLCRGNVSWRRVHDTFVRRVSTCNKKTLDLFYYVAAAILRRLSVGTCSFLTSCCHKFTAVLTHPRVAARLRLVFNSFCTMNHFTSTWRRTTICCVAHFLKISWKVKSIDRVAGASTSYKFCGLSALREGKLVLA